MDESRNFRGEGTYGRIDCGAIPIHFNNATASNARQRNNLIGSLFGCDIISHKTLTTYGTMGLRNYNKIMQGS